MLFKILHSEVLQFYKMCRTTEGKPLLPPQKKKDYELAFFKLKPMDIVSRIVSMDVISK